MVEEVGEPLSAARLRWEVVEFGRTSGQVALGGRSVAWSFKAPDAVAVTHFAPFAALVSLWGRTPATEDYAVEVVTTLTPSDGTRWWWTCPSCERRCGLLYLEHPRTRLACRVCHHLGYKSQYRRADPDPMPGRRWALG
jgi:hypothetical protein